MVTLRVGARVAERVAGLGADAVVPGRVDGAVGDADVLAAVDVHAVAIGVDVEVVDGEVVDAGEQQAEVAALEDGEVAQQDVAAVLEGDGLVADAGLLGLVHRVVAARIEMALGLSGRSARHGGRGLAVGGGASGRLGKEAAYFSGCSTAGPGAEAEAFSVDEAGAGDGDVVEVFTPDERVVPVVVAVVLIRLPGGRWARPRRRCRRCSRWFRRAWASRRRGWSRPVRDGGAHCS